MALLPRLAIAAVFIGSAFGADPRWIRMPSDDFEIYSSAGEGDTRLALQYFERVRAFFEQALAARGKNLLQPVTSILSEASFLYGDGAEEGS
jgi:hypothetical protein